MDPKQFRKYVLVPTLEKIGLYSEPAEELLFGTACQESHLEYLHQLGGGPAIGIYQMEPATHNDIWMNYLNYQTAISSQIIKTEIPGMYQSNNAQEMAGNMYYATAMCRAHYLRVPEALPDASDVQGLAEYWKQHYNTHLGAGTVDEFIHNYERFKE